MAVPAGIRDLRSGGPGPRPAAADPPAAGPHPRDTATPRCRPGWPRWPAGRWRPTESTRSSLAVVGGALDGVERVLGAWLHPGDRVIVEDPGYTAALDLLVGAGHGGGPGGPRRAGDPPRPAGGGARAGVPTAVLLTPRAQNPTGTAWDGSRAAELRTRAGPPSRRPGHRGRPRRPGLGGVGTRRWAGGGSAGPPSARCPSG